MGHSSLTYYYEWNYSKKASVLIQLPICSSTAEAQAPRQPLGSNLIFHAFASSDGGSLQTMDMISSKHISKFSEDCISLSLYTS